MKLPTLTAITLVTTLAAVPAFAQNDQTPQPGKTAGATTAAATTDTNTGNPPAVTTVTKPMGTASAVTGTGSNAEIGTATVTSDKKTNTNVADMSTAKTDTANALPHQRNPVLADNGQPRASKIIGSNVYNMQDQKVGSVDDVLMGVNGQPDQAVISVKDKLVLVPFDKLVFGNTKVNSDNRVILPDETRDALANMPEFHYNMQNKG